MLQIKPYCSGVDKKKSHQCTKNITKQMKYQSAKYSTPLFWGEKLYFLNHCSCFFFLMNSVLVY